jgi:ABC-type sugar transport system substrate-binding protein
MDMLELAVAKERVDVVVILITEKNDYQRLQAKDAEETTKRLGLTSRVLFGENPFNQLELIYRECTRPDESIRPKMLIIEPVGSNSKNFESFRKVLSKVMSLGIRAGVVNQEIDGFTPNILVTSDPKAIGLLQAQQCKGLLPKGGNVFVVGGPNGSTAADMRLEGLQEGLRGTNITFLKDSIRMSEWDGSGRVGDIRSALKTLKAIGTTIHLVVGQNDSLAIAAKIALDEIGQRDVPVIGVDGTPEVGQRQVDGGILDATVITPSATGQAINQLNREHPQGKLILEPKSYMKFSKAA